MSDDHMSDAGYGLDESYEWLVFQGGPDGPAHVGADAIYHDRDPYGEYILFAAANPAAVNEQGLCSIQSYAYLAEVRVSYEADLLDDARQDIVWCQEDSADQGDAFAKDVWPSWQDVSLDVVANSIFPEGQDFVMAKSVLAVGEDAASFVEVTRIEAGGPSEMALTFCKIEQDRLLEIKTVLKIADMPIYLWAGLWQDLVEQYADFAYEKLNGARRVEPEPEDFDFGDVEE
ncbi:MAG: hypothetical protein OIF56_12300 [Cohaesibacter sp.]|nr:hypothetical protein [Cohaesibacter sp.]